MTKLSEVQKSIDLMTKKVSLFCWEDFGDKGNNCIGRWDVLSDVNECAVYAEQFALVLQAMPKGGMRHLKLNKSLAMCYGSHWYSYDWLVKAVARILMGVAQSSELERVINVAELIKDEMKKKGISKIDSLEELFA